MTYGYVFRWRKFRPELYGRRCALIARGALNSALVEFEGGERHIVSRNALRKATDKDQPAAVPHTTEG